MNNTKIEWCDATWNPVTGCKHGCNYCYARKQANRFKGCISDSTKATRRFTSEETKTIALYEVTSEMYRITKKGDTVVAPYPFGFAPTFYRYLLDIPQHWKKPRTIFVCSMADLFGAWVPDEWIEAVFAACEKAPQHRFLFLTKNPNRYAKLANDGKLPKRENMWYGTTVATNEMPYFYGGGYNTFLSIEPILAEFPPLERPNKSGIEWIIVGAETGNRKGKVIPEKQWIDEICKSADKAHSPVFMKESLLPIMGEEGMRREFPWERGV